MDIETKALESADEPVACAVRMEAVKVVAADLPIFGAVAK